jgi:tetratricopeptide (TPR) repeat protein
MPDFAERFRLSKMRSGNAAVYLLKEQFERFLTSPRRVDVCEWVASCLYQLEQYNDAADWYEVAGQLLLAEPGSPPAIRALFALDDYQKALECHRRDDNDEAFEEVSGMIRQLRKACASA